MDITNDEKAAPMGGGAAQAGVTAGAPSSGNPTVNPFDVPQRVKLANKYVVCEKIGSGAFGNIYSGTKCCIDFVEACS